jgi:hypothetical protein
MKVDFFETHDRLLHFKSDWDVISQGVQDCIDNVPEEIKMPFYVFGHSRQIGMDERFNLFFQGHWQEMKDVPSERIIWMPRITKPLAEPNSYLFKAKKGTDLVDIEWILPKKELWDQYEPGKMTHNEVIWTSIQNYKHARAEMEYDDNNLSLEKINEFKRIIRSVAIFNQKNKNLNSFDEIVLS